MGKHFKSVDEYQMFTERVKQGDLTMDTALNGILRECAELANEIHHSQRDEGGRLTPARRTSMASEIGDIMWYCAQLALCCDLALSTVLTENYEKLTERYPDARV